MTVTAHYDGKVIVPDEPLDLAPNQPLVVQVRVAAVDLSPESSALSWLAENAVDDAAFPIDLADRHDRYLYGDAPES